MWIHDLVVLLPAMTDSLPGSWIQGPALKPERVLSRLIQVTTLGIAILLLAAELPMSIRLAVAFDVTTRIFEHPAYLGTGSVRTVTVTTTPQTAGATSALLVMTLVTVDIVQKLQMSSSLENARVAIVS